MTDLDIFMRLGLALAIGLMLGLERGWHGRKEAEGGRLAGLRTFALTGLLGGITGWLADLSTPMLPALAMLALGVILAAAYWARLRGDSDLGLTTEVALLLTFGLGVAAVLGDIAPTAAVAVVAATLLSMKPALHGMIARIERLELEALFKLGLISLVVLPLLPRRGFGPGGVINPFDVWWAVVIVAGLSFVGYLAIRISGARLGMLATGLFGGLASSTATTLSLSRIVRSDGTLAPLAAAGIVLAGSVTFLRILVLAYVFQPSLVASLARPMVAMALAGLVGAVLLQLRAGRGARPPEDIRGIANPLELTAALIFGGVLVLVLIGVHYLRQWQGTEGVFAAAAISGLTDVDALTISVARLVGQDLPAGSGAMAIFIAASVNTAVKAGISLGVGGRRLGRSVIAAYSIVILAGALAVWAGQSL